AEFSVDQLASFWFVVKNIGIGELPDRRIDLFDRVFNNPALLQGRDPYRPADDVPFDPSDPQPWKVHGTSLQDTEIRGRLGAALLLSDDDLSAAADYLLCLEGGGDTLQTDLPTLSNLYRIAGSARAAGIGVSEYLLMLRLMYDHDKLCVAR